MSTNKNDFFIPSKLRSHTKTSKMKNGEVKAVPKESEEKKKRRKQGGKASPDIWGIRFPVTSLSFSGVIRMFEIYILYYAYIIYIHIPKYDKKTIKLK